MKCSICGKDASFSIPRTHGAKNRVKIIDEYRCAEHANLGRSYERQIHKAILNENFTPVAKKIYNDLESKKIKIEPIISEPSEILKSEPSE